MTPPPSARLNNASLWLVPPEDSALYKALHTLINSTIPSLYPNATTENFIPHITLTADTIPKDLPNPQEALENLIIPNLSGQKIRIQDLDVGEIYFQKLIQLCEKTPQLCKLATCCRAAGTKEGMESAEKWVEENYTPHCSLMYSDISREEVLGKMEQLKGKVREVKESFGAKCLLAKGGAIWLVNTYDDVSDWKAVAERELDPSVMWHWETKT